MYEEGNRHYGTNVGLFLIKLILLVAIVLLACWIFIRITNSSKKSTSIASTDIDFVTNINTMKTAAFEYFTPSNLPTKIGGVEKLTLSQMLNQKLLIDFTDNGNKCDIEQSYIQATKTAENNYAVKVNLSCGSKSDFIVTTIENTTQQNNKPATNTDVIVSDVEEEKEVSKVKDTTKKENNTKVVYQPQPSTTTVTTTVTTKVSVSISGCCPVNCTTYCSNNCERKETIPKQEIKYYVVDFDLNGGSCYIKSQKIAENGYVQEPCVPKKTNYVFDGWYLGEEKYSFANKVNSNFTLVAHWKKNESTKMYKLVKYSDWLDGYSNVSGDENKKFTETSYNYCKLTNDTYYAAGWIPTNPTNKKYSYEYQINNLNANDIIQSTISISNKDYFNNFNLNDYISFMDDNNIPKMEISGSNSIYDATVENAYKFRNSALKSNNFTFDLSDIYLKNGNYRTNITINYLNGNGVEKYNSCNPKINTPIYFVPLKFNVSYAKKSDCIRDYYTNNANYKGYIVLDKKEETVWKHRTPTYKWSSSTKEDGWDYTGESKCI